MNSWMYLQPLKRSFPLSTLKISCACWSQFLPSTLVRGRRVAGLMVTWWSNFSSPKDQLTSGAGREGTWTLQSRKISSTCLCSSSRLLTYTRSSLVSPSQNLGSLFLTSRTCSSSAAPSTGMNSEQTSTVLTFLERREESTRKPFWQSPRKRFLKHFLPLLSSLLNFSMKLQRARVRRQWRLKPLCRGYPRVWLISSICSMSQRWKRKVSFSVGWFRQPLERQYHSAMSEPTWVATYWERPHMLAIVLVVRRRCRRCSVRLGRMGFSHSISPACTITQITARYMFRLPITLPFAISTDSVLFPTATCDLCVPSGIAPSSLFCVKGFFISLSEYFTPVKVDSLERSLDRRWGQLRMRSGQAEMSSTTAFSRPSRKGSHSSMRIWGTSSSRMMGHSMGCSESSAVWTEGSMTASTASAAVAILLDLIWSTLYCPLRSPQRLMRQRIFFSSSPDPCAKYWEDMFSMRLIAPSKLLAFNCSLTLELQSPSRPSFLENSLTRRPFMATSWFFRGRLPSFPMLSAMISCSITVYCLSKFSRVMFSSSSSTLQSSAVYCMTALRGLAPLRLKTLLSLQRVKGQVTDRLGSLQLPITQQIALLIVKP